MMSISSLETDARLDPATSGPKGVFQQLQQIRRVRHRLTRELHFTLLRQHPSVAFIGATALRKSGIDRDTVTLVVIIVVACGFWFGQASRETLGGCTTSPPSMEFVPELNVAMTVKSGVACAIWARVMIHLSIPKTKRRNPSAKRYTQNARFSGVIYRPDKGYVGEDAFAFVRQGASQYHKGD